MHLNLNELNSDEVTHLQKTLAECCGSSEDFSSANINDMSTPL